MIIRSEREEDFAAIRRVNQAAFGRPDEGRLVDAIRESGALICSLVVEVEGQIAGHVLFTPVTLDMGNGEVTGAGLGPVAVLPGFQRQGLGFRPSRPLGIRWEHNAPEEAFMVMALRDGGVAGLSGIIRYRPEFDGV